jgi:hypothetical protein
MTLRELQVVDGLFMCAHCSEEGGCNRHGFGRLRVCFDFIPWNYINLDQFFDICVNENIEPTIHLKVKPWEKSKNPGGLTDEELDESARKLSESFWASQPNDSEHKQKVE